MATMPKPVPVLDVQKILRENARKYENYMNARDVDSLVSRYATDGRILAPFKPMAQGFAAIRHLFEEMFKENDPRNMKIETECIELNENVASCVGTFTMNVLLPTGKRIDYRGKWATTERLIEGDSKILFHTYNTDLPFTDFFTK